MKSLFKPLIALFLLATFGSLWSCVDECDKEDAIEDRHKLDLKILGKETNRNLLGIGSNRYNRDTVQIFDENLEPLGIRPDLDGSMILYFLRNVRHDDEPLDTDLESTYYLYFEEGDYDTLSMTYRLALDHCDDIVLTQWSTSYNDSLYFEFTSNVPRTPSVSFFK